MMCVRSCPEHRRSEAISMTASGLIGDVPPSFLMDVLCLTRSEMLDIHELWWLQIKAFSNSLCNVFLCFPSTVMALFKGEALRFCLFRFHSLPYASSTNSFSGQWKPVTLAVPCTKDLDIYFPSSRDRALVTGTTKIGGL
jgi:hypothetical protein